MLKIDQTFVRDMLDDPGDLAIVQGVVGLAGAFHRDVVAEGVETSPRARLLGLGCHVMQGYGISDRSRRNTSAPGSQASDRPGWTAARAATHH